MKEFYAYDINFALNYLFSQEMLDNTRKAIKSDDLTGFFTDVWNMYVNILNRYGKGKYADFKMNAFLVDLYDRMEPDLDFEDYIQVIYFKKDEHGNLHMPDMLD